MRNQVSKIFKNTGALMFATGLQPVLNFVLVLFISRMFSKEGLGEYTAAFAIYNIFQLFCAFGMKMFLAREIAKHPKDVNNYLSNGMIIVLGFSIFSAVGMMMTVMLLNYSSEVALLANLLAISLIATAFIECFLGVLIGFERLGFVAMITVLEEAFKVAVSVFFLLSGYSILSVVITFVILRFISAFVIYVYVFKVIDHPKLVFNLSFCWDIIQKVSYFAFSIIFMAIYWQVDIVILSKLGTIEDVGLYGAAFRLFRILFILMQSFLMAIFPVLSRVHHENLDRFVALYGRISKYLLIVILPLTLCAIFSADKIILFIFKKDFIDSFPVFRILAAGLFPFVLSNLLAYVLLASNHQEFDLFSNIMGVIIKIFFVYYLTRLAGYKGTAIGSFIGFWGRLIVQTIYLRKGQILASHFRQTIIVSIKTILAAGFLVGVVFLVKGLNLYLALLAGLSVYVIFVFIFNLISEEEKNLIQNTIHAKWMVLRKS